MTFTVALTVTALIVIIIPIIVIKNEAGASTTPQGEFNAPRETSLLTKEPSVLKC